MNMRDITWCKRKPLLYLFCFNHMYFEYIMSIHWPYIQTPCVLLKTTVMCHPLWVLGSPDYFYPRPVLAFGYCRCLRVCVCLSVCVAVNHLLFFSYVFCYECQLYSCEISLVGACGLKWVNKLLLTYLLVRAITRDPFKLGSPKFGQKMQNTLVKASVVFWTDRPWPSRSNLTWKSKFTPFWVCPHHNSPPIQTRITIFGPKVQNTLVKILIVFFVFICMFFCLFVFFFFGGGGGGGQLTLTFKVKYDLKSQILRFYSAGNT